MGNVGGIDHLNNFQFNWLNAKMLEQPDTASEQNGYLIYLDHVQQSGFKALLDNTRGRDRNIFIPGGLLRLTNGAFNTVSDEHKRRTFPDPFLWWIVSHDKTG